MMGVFIKTVSSVSVSRPRISIHRRFAEQVRSQGIYRVTGTHP